MRTTRGMYVCAMSALGAVVLSTVPASAGVVTETFGTAGVAYGSQPVWTHIPAPSASDYAEVHNASVTQLVGTPHSVSGSPSVLFNGSLTSNNDDPSAAYFGDSGQFNFVVDLHSSISIAEINTYSRHQQALTPPNSSRAPQDYTVLGSNDINAVFTPIATVANSYGEVVYGNSITSGTGSLGTYQYLEFDTNAPNGGQGTFYGEIDVLQVVPEPASATMIGIAATALLARRRNKTRG